MCYAEGDRKGQKGEHKMNLIIRALLTAVAAFGLLRLFFTAQELAQGKPQARWISISYWIFWTAACLVCVGLLGLVVWVGFSLWLEQDWRGAMGMAVTALLVGAGDYMLFFYPLQKRWKK